MVSRAVKVLAEAGRWADAFTLISEFDRQTGVPLVLNTSFNEHEPIVTTPGEALSCYLRTHMDVLALGNWLLTRPSANVG